MGFGEDTSPETERVATQIVDAAFKIHSTLGPGLLESAYRALMVYELTKRGTMVRKEVVLPVVFEAVQIDVGYRVDLIVNDTVIIDLKAIDKIHAIHEAQLLTYLKLSEIRLGFLINFNSKLIKDGIKRMVL